MARENSHLSALQANLVAYASLYLHQEVHVKALVPQMGDFKRFLAAASASGVPV